MDVQSRSNQLSKNKTGWKKSESRWECDSLGSVEIPGNALYGIQTARALACMSFSDSTLSQYPDLIASLALVKKACAMANLEANVLSIDVCEGIRQACDEVMSGRHDHEFSIDMLHGGGSIGFNQNVNEVLANLSNVRLGRQIGDYAPVSRQHVNAGQSTADVCHTAFRLCIRARITKLIEVLQHMLTILVEKQNEFQHVETLARTCLQDAMPVALGTTFGAFASFISRRLNCLDTTARKLDEVNLGGTVIGDGGGAEPRYREAVLSCLSGLVGRELSLRSDLFDAAQHMDDLTDVSSELTALAEGLVKLSKDLRLLSSGPHGGFFEIVLPSVIEGSSFFKGKINPVIPESMIQACMVVFGLDRIVQSAAEHGELNLNVFDGLAAKSILDATQILEKAISMFSERCIDGIKANRERCHELSSMGFGLKQDDGQRPN
jgi:aspartate ammonia-lyase